MAVHPSAMVSPEADIGEEVEIGPFVIIEPGTVIGDRCQVEASAQIRSGTRLGPDCFVGSGAILGADPQFRGFDRRVRSGVRAGRANVFREYVTLHRSIHEGGETRLGEDNFLMTGSHVGHDAILGNHNTLANNVLLAGHVELGDHCFLGGGSVFHQHVRVGDYVITQGNSGFSLDLPPYVIGSGINVVVGVNAVGLKRAQFATEDLARIKSAFREVFWGESTLREILDAMNVAELPPSLRRFYDFLGRESKKGLCIRPSQGGKTP
jgi:UDP-N-acetylglucosamine acyltransferase